MEDDGKYKSYLGRITFNPEIMGGRACIRGMRITVALVLKLLASDMSIEEGNTARSRKF